MEIRTPDTREQVNMVLECLRRDREKSRTMQPDGRYVRDEGGAGTSSQEALYQYFSRRQVTLEPPEEEKTMLEEPPQARRESIWDRLRRGIRGGK